MSHLEISNPHVKQIVTTLPQFLRIWSLIIILGLLMTCLLLINLICFTSLTKIAVTANSTDLVKLTKKQNEIILLGSISGDQKDLGLIAKECNLAFYNFLPVFHGELVQVLPTKSSNVYQLKFVIDNQVDLTSFKQINKSLSGTISIIHKQETMASKIVTSFRTNH